MRSLIQLPIRVRPPFQIPHRAICLIPSIGSWRVYPLHPNRPQREFYSEYSHPIMRLRFGRNLNSLTSYDRINRIMVRTKSCRRWRRFCRNKDNLKSPNMPPDQTLLKGLLPSPMSCAGAFMRPLHHTWAPPFQILTNQTITPSNQNLTQFQWFPSPLSPERSATEKPLAKHLRIINSHKL